MSKIIFLNDIKFRRVLALAIDKNKILQEALNNDGQIIQGPILPGSLGFDANVKDLDYDLEAAKKELEALGWTLKEGSNYRQKSEQELTLKLTLMPRFSQASLMRLTALIFSSCSIVVNFRFNSCSLFWR